MIIEMVRETEKNRDFRVASPPWESSSMAL
jgi:hypothetical protein